MPAQVLISIFLYLSPIEIIRLERCLKYFKDIITSPVKQTVTKCETKGFIEQMFFLKKCFWLFTKDKFK